MSDERDKQAQPASDSEQPQTPSQTPSEESQSDVPDVKEVEKALAVLANASPGVNWTARLGNIGVALQEWRQAIIDDMGGDETISAMERVLVDIAAKGYMMLDMIDQYIFDKYDQKIIDFDRQQARFIVMQRRALADSVARYIKDLGLKKRRPQRRVSDIIAEIMKDENEAPEDLDTSLDAKAIHELRGDRKEH